MKRVNLRLTIVAALILLGILSLSCSKRDILDSKNQTGRLVMEVVWPDSPDAPDEKDIEKPTDAPPGVQYIDISVDGPDFETMTWRFSASDNEGNLDGIPVGDNRTINVFAKDNNENELYYYEEQNISIYPDQTADVTVNFIQYPPAPPSNLNGSFITDHVALSWQDNSPNEDYFIIARKVAGYDYSILDSVGPNIVSYEDYSISLSSDYYYQIRAENSGGSSAYSAEVYVAVSENYIPPPDLSSVFWASDTVIAVTWVDNSDDETGFTIERQNYTISGNWVTIGNVGPNIVAFLDSNFDPNTYYLYHIKAERNGEYSEPSNEEGFDTGNPPPVPPRIKSCFFDGSSMVVRWNTTPADSFFIYRSFGQETEYSLWATVFQSDSVYYDYNNSGGGWYRYKMKACNSYGYSSFGDPDSGFVDLNGPLFFRGIMKSENDESYLGKLNYSDGVLYAADGGDIEIYDVNNQNFPYYLSSTHLSGGYIRGMFRSGDLRLFAITDSILYSFDITSPREPTYLANMDLGSGCRSVAVQNGMAYVGTDQSGLYIIDVSTYGNMSYVNNYPNSQEINDIRIGMLNDSLYAFLACGNYDFVILNVTDPYSIVYTNNYALSSPARAVRLFDTKAYIADGASGVDIIDYTDVFSLGLSGTIYTQNAFSLYVDGIYTIIADGENGLKVVNTSDLQDVDLFYPVGGLCKDVLYIPTTNYLYASVPSYGIYIFKISP